MRSFVSASSTLSFESLSKEVSCPQDERLGSGAIEVTALAEPLGDTGVIGLHRSDHAERPVQHAAVQAKIGPEPRLVFAPVTSQRITLARAR